MKKTIFLAVALLLAAVFMSGCVAETDEPVIGVWMSTEPMQHPGGDLFDPVTYVFLEDGTGFCLATFSGEMISGRLDFTWKNLGGGKYEVVQPAFAEDLRTAASGVVTLADGKLTITIEGGDDLVLVPASLENYAPGFWMSDQFDYQEYEDATVMLYLAADKTGSVGMFGPDVSGLADVHSADFTWEVAEDKVVITGQEGKVFELSLVDGGLSFDNLKPMQKYTVTDHVVGLWISDEPHVEDGISYDIVQAIRYDGTGMEFWIVPDSSTASAMYAFTWEMTSPYSYKASYEDGEVWDFYFAGDIQLYDGELFYSKVSFDVLTDYAEKRAAA